ncbi:MAG: acyl-CoA desaturase, partial [Gammaproteobacteria bacterium]
MTRTLLRWLDNARRAQTVAPDDDRVDWRRIWPFIALHVAAVWALWQGASTAALMACAVSYLIRMFGITAFYHRGLSHKAFRMSRTVQFIGALLGTTATQRGPLWWAAHHRHHHQHADTDRDAHSPRHGFLRSHCGWFLSRKGFHAPAGRVKDLERFPELVWLDRFDLVVVIAYGL